MLLPQGLLLARELANADGLKREGMWGFVLLCWDTVIAAGSPSLEEQFAGLKLCPGAKGSDGREMVQAHQQPQILVLLNWATVVLLLPIPVEWFV